MSVEAEPPVKVYVPVQVAFDRLGYMIPTKIRWEDGRVFRIDEVVSIRKNQRPDCGSQTDLYEVRIRGKNCRLFFEKSRFDFSNCPGRWFVEKP